MSLVEEYNQLTAKKQIKIEYKAKVVAALLNVRTGPGYGEPVLKVIARGEEYTFTEEKENWGFLNELNGWVCLDFVEKIAVPREEPQVAKKPSVPQQQKQRKTSGRKK